jgi:ribosome-associated toxin RatA of RatAB toxin-antitoxin module
MISFGNKAILNIPVKRIWEIFSDVRNYPKYFKHVKIVQCKDKEIKLGTVWHDFATFVVPARVKHIVTVLEKEKSLGFDVKIFKSGFIKERVLFTEIGKITMVEININFDFNNRLLSFLFNSRLKRRLSESIEKAILKAKKELEPMIESSVDL